MPAPISPKNSGPFGRMDTLYYHIGRSILAWQAVEEEHFKLFFRLIGSPFFEKAAVVYYGMGDFRTRHVVIKNLLQITLKDREFNKQRKIWHGHKSDLQTDIENANNNRNKLAHYESFIGARIDPTTSSDEASIVEAPTIKKIALSGPTLRPSAYNVVSRLLGWTPDRRAHDLRIETIESFADSFKSLAQRIDNFRQSCPLSPSAGLQQRTELPPKHLLGRENQRS